MYKKTIILKNHAFPFTMLITGGGMKKAVSLLVIFLLVTAVWAQNRHALVIGNANYSDAKDRLPNAINDTNDISSALKKLGYDVVLKQDLDRLDMITEVDEFVKRLMSNTNSEGFFWYAGHGIEFDGEGYLLPKDVDMRSEIRVKNTSYRLNDLTKSLDKVRNKANVLVIDACRVPPNIGGEQQRSAGDTTRVIKSVPHIPADLMIIYSTAPGTTASDGNGRNSPFAEAFLKNMTEAVPLTIVTARVIRDTSIFTSNRQRPYIGGSFADEHYSLSPVRVNPLPDITNMVLINGGTFTMGSPRTEANRDRDETQHQVTVSSFYMSAKEVTLNEYLKVMQFNPNGLVQGANMPVISINWYNAIEYCNARSIAEGLTPAYIINYSIKDPNNHNEDDIYRYLVIWDKSANGYRLPTEAEWEYACRAGTNSAYYNGASITYSQAVYNIGTVFPVGNFSPNRWGLYDMHGNVAEWCWDWYGEYETGDQTNPSGANSGKWRVARGGSWRNSKQQHLRSAYRFSLTPTWFSNNMGIRLVRSVIHEQQPQSLAALTHPDYSLINAQRRAYGTKWQFGFYQLPSSVQKAIDQLEKAGFDISSVSVKEYYYHGSNGFRVFINENLFGTMRILLYQAGFRDAYISK
jgi:formylglycine-generating enzyme required for sulfatase activity